MIFDDSGDIFEGSSNLIIDTITYDNITPKNGVYLSLDVSKNSTGVTLIENGERVVGNIVLEEQVGDHKEVLYRRALKRDLLQLVEGKDFDLIIIEDAYVGENPDTVRLLFALNTAIDEMILDGICTCKKFLRVSNKLWKSWLSVVDSTHAYKGLNDKEKIRNYLEILGITDDREGYQDRLDSMGMLAGYFLKGSKEEKPVVKKKKVNINDIEASYDVDTGYLFYDKDDIDTDKIVFIDNKRVSKSKVIELLTNNPETIFITAEKVKLGNLGEDLGLDILEDGGYFAFWIKPKKLKKYLK